MADTCEKQINEVDRFFMSLLERDERLQYQHSRIRIGSTWPAGGGCHWKRNMSKEHIQDVILHSLQEYFKDLDGQKPTDVYNMIMHTVEKPVLMGGHGSCRQQPVACRRNAGHQPEYPAKKTPRTQTPVTGLFIQLFLYRFLS